MSFRQFCILCLFLASTKISNEVRGAEAEKAKASEAERPGALLLQQMELVNNLAKNNTELVAFSGEIRRAISEARRAAEKAQVSANGRGLADVDMIRRQGAVSRVRQLVETLENDIDYDVSGPEIGQINNLVREFFLPPKSYAIISGDRQDMPSFGLDPGRSGFSGERLVSILQRTQDSLSTAADLQGVVSTEARILAQDVVRSIEIQRKNTEIMERRLLRESDLVVALRERSFNGIMLQHLLRNNLQDANRRISKNGQF